MVSCAQLKFSYWNWNWILDRSGVLDLWIKKRKFNEHGLRLFFGFELSSKFHGLFSLYISPRYLSYKFQRSRPWSRSPSWQWMKAWRVAIGCACVNRPEPFYEEGNFVYLNLHYCSLCPKTMLSFLMDLETRKLLRKDVNMLVFLTITCYLSPVSWDTTLITLVYFFFFLTA